MTTEHQRQNNKMKAPRALHGRLQQVLRDRVNEQVREVYVMVCPHNTGVDNKIISRKSSTWRHFSCNITGKKCVWRTSKRCANGALDLPQTWWQECARECVWESVCYLTSTAVFERSPPPSPLPFLQCWAQIMPPAPPSFTPDCCYTTFSLCRRNYWKSLFW